ncbi:hypothetical protein PL325_04910 [Clostridium perfringens D]|nr:hypothetical protein PL325_04910 [Clostridium perfringens D]
MLDKSIEFFKIILKREKGKELKDETLPEGFRFVKFKKGDEKAWAEIEKSVLEFENTKDGEEYFKNKYLPYIDELERRTIFIENNNGEKLLHLQLGGDIQGKEDIHLWSGLPLSLNIKEKD